MSWKRQRIVIAAGMLIVLLPLAGSGSRRRLPLGIDYRAPAPPRPCSERELARLVIPSARMRRASLGLIAAAVSATRTSISLMFTESPRASRRRMLAATSAGLGGFEAEMCI